MRKAIVEIIFVLAGLFFSNILYSQTMPKPVLNYPANSSFQTTTKVYFGWNPISNADAYQIIIAGVPNWTDDDIITWGETDDNSGWFILEDGKTYYWNVIAYNDYGWSEWSDTFSFTVIASPVIHNYNLSNQPAGWGAELAIYGENFGKNQGSGKVKFFYRDSTNQQLYVDAEVYTHWSNDEIRCLIPHKASSGPVIVQTNSGSGTGTNSTYDISWGYNEVYWPTDPANITYRVDGSGFASSKWSTQQLETFIHQAAENWNSYNTGALFNFEPDDGTTYYPNLIGFSVPPNPTDYAYTYTVKIGNKIQQCAVKINPNIDWDYNYDLETAMTHEFGHWLSLTDLYGANDINKVMYGYYNRTIYNLTDSETKAIQAIYGVGTLTGMGGGLDNFPAPPENVQATVSGQNITLTWDPVEYSTNAQIEIVKNGNDDYPITLNYTETSYSDYNVSFPCTYIVRVTNNMGTANALPVTFFSGNINSSTYWQGNVYVFGNITVNSGAILTIRPGTNITFKNNASLLVNGLINAVGTETAPIKFTAANGNLPNSWGSIELNGAGASGSIIDNCNILYGNGVRVINVPSFTVSNNNLLDNYISLYIYGSTGGISGNTLSSNSIGHSIQLSYSNVDCNNNKITKTGAGIKRGHGIEHNQGSSGKVWRNDVSYCDWGIAAIWGSSPTSRKPNTSILRNNRIRNCNSGLMVYRLSYPNFGIPSTPIYWGNSIYNNTYNAVVAFNYPTYASSLTASNCWWGAAPPNTAKFSVGSKGSFYYDFNLTSDPWAGFQKVLPENNIETETENLSVSNSVQSNANTDEDILYQCVELREQNKFTEAMNLCLSYLEKQPEDQAGYVELYNCYSEETAERIISYFNALPKEASSDLKLLLSYLYLKQGDVEKAKQVNEAIVETDENSDLSVKANLNNFYIALYTENDPDEAVDILLGMVDNTKLAKASGTSVGEMSDAEYSLIQYSKIYDKQIPDLERLKQGIKTLEEGKPDKFELAQNFPNPFNPSTMISYQLPINGYVTLKIYDLLGQEIATLVNEQKSAGKYEVKFDASDLASGVYIYRIQAGEFNASKKLILLK